MLSWVAVARLMERKMAADANYRRQAAGRPLRSAAVRLSDEELLAKLHAFGIEFDRTSLAQLCTPALSAEEIAIPFIEDHDRRPYRGAPHSDWIWICIATLWQRWFPDTPSFESLDDEIQAGYVWLASGDVTAACRVWLDAWRDVLRILDKTGMQTVGEFDNQFRGTQSVFNWLQDLEGELWNAGLRDRQFLTARIRVCEEGLRRFHGDDPLITENRRRALAASYQELGETDKADALFREWLTTDPRWGWGWIGWADNYQFTRTERRDVPRAEQILREGLAVPDVRDEAALADRLADLCADQGRHDEAMALRRQANISTATEARTVHSTGTVLRAKTQITFGDAGLPLGEMANVVPPAPHPIPATTHRQKIGRNDPCPCGSGKKFKKCCGRDPSTL